MSIADYIKNKLPYWPNWINFILLKLNIFGGWVYGRAYRKCKNTIDTTNPEDKLLKIVNYAIGHVPYYRKRYGDLIIHSKQEFEEKIGFIDKDEVMSHWDEFLSDEIDWSKCHTGTTGGTSGKPLKLVTPRNRYSWELAYMHRLWNKAGWNYDVRGIIRNHDLKERDYVINPIMKEIIFDSHKMSESYALRVYQVLRKFKVKYITAYPSNAYQFSSFCIKQKLDISFIKAFLCGSEGVTYEQKQFFERNNIKILSYYGHSEKLILGSNELSSSVFTMERGYGLCELLDSNDVSVDDAGEMGELVGTTYHNYYFPLIRYKTGDYATLISRKENLQLENIVGRWDKTLLFRKDGTTIALSVLNLHGDFYEHIDGIQYFQEKIGYIKVLIIKNSQYTDADEDFIKEHLGVAMGGKQYVDIVYSDNLVFQPNGKFLPLISKIQA